MNEYRLEPIYDHQKSFYGKAKVREIMGIKILTSYETDVAAITPDGAIHRLWQGQYIEKNYGMYGTYEEWQEWTATTGKHIREFAKQNGQFNFGKKEYLKLEVEELSELIKYAALRNERTKTEIA